MISILYLGDRSLRLNGTGAISIVLFEYNKLFPISFLITYANCFIHWKHNDELGKIIIWLICRNHSITMQTFVY